MRHAARGIEADAPFFSLPELVEGREKMGLERIARRPRYRRSAPMVRVPSAGGSPKTPKSKRCNNFYSTSIH
jgi:hypothetical protein